MYQTFIKDEQGRKHVVTQSHKDTNAVIRRIAELNIKHFGLNCTIDEYIERCRSIRLGPKVPSRG